MGAGPDILCHPQSNESMNPRIENEWRNGLGMDDGARLVIMQQTQ